MIEVNKPVDTTPNIRCYRCKAEFYVHPMADINSPWIKDCNLHNPECEHEPDVYEARQLGSTPDTEHEKCKKCGEFYR